jgi:YVTN family beta-propeller protein
VSVIDIATRSVTKTIAVGAKPNGIVFRSKS